MDFDYSVGDPAARCRSVARALPRRPSRADLSAAADYILMVGDPGAAKAERASDAPVLTRNRMVTVSKREVSMEAMADGCAADGRTAEEAVSSVAAGRPEAPLDRRRARGEPAGDALHDAAVASMMEAAASLERQASRAEGRRRFELKRQAIEFYRDAHLARELGRQASPPVQPEADAFRQPTTLASSVVLDPATLMPRAVGGASLLDPACCRALMRCAWALWPQVESDLSSDVRPMLEELRSRLDRVYPAGTPERAFLDSAMSGAPLAEAAAVGDAAMRSAGRDPRPRAWWGQLWGRSAPQAVADDAARSWLLANWEDPVAGRRKRCTRCGRSLPPHPLWFSRNTSRDGYYSICKSCRSADARAVRRS